MPWSKHDSTTAGGDLTSKDLHVEHKRVEPHVKSIGVKRAWLKKVTEGANRRMKVPAMVISYEQPHGHDQDWVMMPLDTAKRLMALAEDDDE